MRYKGSVQLPTPSITQFQNLDGTDTLHATNPNESCEFYQI